MAPKKSTKKLKKVKKLSNTKTLTMLMDGASKDPA